MVLRVKKNRKYFGTRTWGWGNKKNRRGSGSRGGVGRGGRKSKWTRTVKYERERIHTPGFVPPRREKLREISLGRISSIARKAAGEKPTLEFNGYKVLSNGSLSKPVVIKATSFSAKAEEKIKQAGGEAVRLE
ncbi:MAG: uL15m family ribosomal protein [Candidatus Micrarchaeaceae archaeon]